MRRIVVEEFMSLDGVVQGPGPEDNFELAGWTMPYFTPEIGQIIGESIAASDALLLGRVTYQGFESSFSSQTDGMSMALNNQPKYVVSTTMKQATWKNSTLINGNVIQEIRDLKQQPGKDIAISGSITLAQSLMEHGLIDEFGLIKDGAAMMTLNLLEARPLSNGVVYLRYQPDKSA
jgi:dihydrofolate reductase